MAEREERSVGPPPGAGWTPVPDPTALTGTLVEAAKDQLRREVAGSIATLTMRLDGIDKTLQLLQTMTDRLPMQAQNMVDQLARLHEEKFKTTSERFASVGIQFAERDARVEQASKDSSKALEAALSAAKELVNLQNTASTTAIDKSEKATAEQIKQVMTMITTLTNSIESKMGVLTEQVKGTVSRDYVDQATRAITDKVDQGLRTVNEKIEGNTGIAIRLQSMESRALGRTEQQQVATQGTQWAIGLALGIAGLLVGILFHVLNK